MDHQPRYPTDRNKRRSAFSLARNYPLALSPGQFIATKPEISLRDHPKGHSHARVNPQIMQNGKNGFVALKCTACCCNNSDGAGTNIFAAERTDKTTRITKSGFTGNSPQNNGIIGKKF